MKYLFSCLIVILISGCSNPTDTPAERVLTISGATMGTQYHIRWVASDETANPAVSDTAALKNLVDQRLVEINQVMSTYDPNSELSKINQLIGDIELERLNIHTVSPDLYEVIEQSLDVFHKSGGLFDITVGPLVNLWGFGKDPSKTEPPAPELIKQAMQRMGSQMIKLQETHILAPQGWVMDVSAIAKGWAVDDLAELLEQQGIHSYLVEIGGDLIVKGLKPNGKGWTIAIERPTANIADQQHAQLIFAPGNHALATSGDYRNYFEHQGIRYSHTINPTTGYPVQHNLASVSVVHESAAMADAWATALNVAGAERGLVLAEQYGLKAYMIVREGDGFTEYASNAFKQAYPTLTISQGQ